MGGRGQSNTTLIRWNMSNARRGVVIGPDPSATKVQRRKIWETFNESLPDVFGQPDYGNSGYLMVFQLGNGVVTGIRMNTPRNAPSGWFNNQVFKITPQEAKEFSTDEAQEGYRKFWYWKDHPNELRRAMRG